MICRFMVRSPLSKKKWPIHIALLSVLIYPWHSLTEFLYSCVSVHSYARHIWTNSTLFWSPVIAEKRLWFSVVFLSLQLFKVSGDQISAMWLARMYGYSEINACGWVLGFSICGVSSSDVSCGHASAGINIKPYPMTYKEVNNGLC